MELRRKRNRILSISRLSSDTRICAEQTRNDAENKIRGWLGARVFDARSHLDNISKHSGQKVELGVMKILPSPSLCFAPSRVINPTNFAGTSPDKSKTLYTCPAKSRGCDGPAPLQMYKQYFWSLRPLIFHMSRVLMAFPFNKDPKNRSEQALSQIGERERVNWLNSQ